MKVKSKKSSKKILSDKIADALTVKPRADIEDDNVFGTKPKTVSRVDFSSSESEEEENVISDFRKRNVNLLSEISKKYEGQVVSLKDLEESDSNEGYEQSDGDDVSQLSAQKMTLDDSSDENDSQIHFNNSITSNKSKGEKPASDTSSEDESDDYSITKFQKNGESEESSEEDEENDDDDENEGYDVSQMEGPLKEEFEHVKKQNISEEAKKGACVRNQLLIWEGLLEMRIHMQRCMNTVNQMPLPETYQKFKNNSEFSEECNMAKINICNLLDKFMALQNLFLENFPETKTLSKKQKEDKQEEKKTESDEEISSDTDNEEIPSDTDTGEIKNNEKKILKKSSQYNKAAKKRKLEDYEKDLERTHKVFKSFRDATIQKWNEKTRLATAANIKNTPTNTILQQISYILSDREKLVRRTQLKRSEYDIIGYKKPEVNDNQNDTVATPVTKSRKDDDEYIPEIFDDSDFYHQLLRELIECKSADISDPVQLSRQWIALQQMRSKMKRKVDTKASKGRKVKYVVHNKLVNYMAPEKSTTWTDESTNELYSSLFGKMFENNAGMNANTENLFKIKD